MKKFLSSHALPGLVLSFFLASCQKNIDQSPALVNEVKQEIGHPKDLKDFVQTNLVGDDNEYNPAHIDANLVNAWGIAFPANGAAWVTSFGTSESVIYNGDGTTARPPVAIPSHAAATGGHPTGIVANSTTDFKLPNGNPARFIFAEAEGLLSGWNGGNAAIKMAGDASGEVYLGLALASDGGNNFLYAANFAQGKIDVYDKNWIKVNKPFVDPSLPDGYLPLNIQNIEGKLYVTYGQPGTGGEVISPRNGLINIFNTDGSFLKRFITQGQLNAPWGIAKAPAGFWEDGTDNQDIFLVGNFGDGHINAFDREGVFEGQLRAHGKPIVIERLWGIAFAPATSSLNHNQLFFAAGPDREQHGLFGVIKK
jgi:TIGR03118 family protein